jgi:asparagine synthase (glutamine-hydrolysing)
MGYIAALLSKTNDDVSPFVLKMLEAASPRRGDAYGIASDRGAMITGSPVHFIAPDSHAMLGYKFNKVMPNDPPQPLSQHGYSMIFDGRFWQKLNPSDITMAVNITGAEPSRGIQDLIDQKNGFYAIASVNRGKIFCGRDPVGVVPLYIGENATLAGVASNRKMLWAVDLVARPFPPGHIAEITRLGVSLKPVRTIRQPQIRKISMGNAVEKLDTLLSEVVGTLSRGLFKVALGFSGGIDSSLLAYYLDREGVDVDLICVGMEGSTEFGAAELAADSLDLPISLESFTLSDVDQALDSVLWSIEEPDPMKVGVALPLYWAARRAAESGSKIFFSGNGCDELFGGYHRHVKEYVERGDAVRETLFRDVVASHEVNYERDYKMCMDSGMELRLPFAHLDIIEFGLSLPLELKLPVDEGSPRKRVLRVLAEKLGFPDEVAYRSKKAVQYSTGVNKVLKTMAKRSGKTFSSYLMERFLKVKRNKLTDA